MSLEKLIESYYAPKKGNELLVKLIESKLNEQIVGIEQDPQIINPKDQMFYGDERTLKLPIIRFSKQIGRKNNYERSFLDLVFSNLAQLAGTADERIENRIQSIQKFLDPKTNINPNIKISEIMSHCIISETFYHLVNDYDATVSGDLFEPLFAAMFDGAIVEAENTNKKINAKEINKENTDETSTQVADEPDTEIAPEINIRNTKAEDVYIPVQENNAQSQAMISLKLISERGNVSQSFKSVLKSVKKYGKLYYVVAYKSGKGSVTFYGFELSEDTILESVSNLNDMFPPALVNSFKTEKKKKGKEYSVVGHMLYSIERNSKIIEDIKYDIEEMQKLIKQKEELITKEYSGSKNKYVIDSLKKEIKVVKTQIANLAGQQKLIQQDTSMKIYPSYVRTKKNFGTITYTKENLESVLTNYTNIVNKKVTNIYDNLSLLTNSINDFFLRGQGEDVNLARTSMEKARQVETSIFNYIPEAEE